MSKRLLFFISLIVSLYGSPLFAFTVNTSADLAPRVVTNLKINSNGIAAGKTLVSDGSNSALWKLPEEFLGVSASPYSVLFTTSAGVVSADSSNFVYNHTPVSTDDTGLFLKKTGSSIQDITRTLHTQLFITDNNTHTGSAGTSIWSEATANANGNINHIVSNEAYTYIIGSHDVGAGYLYNGYAFQSGLGIVTDWYGMKLDFANITGDHFKNVTGILIGDLPPGDQSGGVNYSIYTGTAPTRLGGRIDAPTGAFGAEGLSDGGSELLVQGANSVGIGQLNVRSSDAYTTQLAGKVTLGGKYNSSNAYFTAAQFEGNKSDNGNGTFVGDAVISANTGGAGINEIARFSGVDSSTTFAGPIQTSGPTNVGLGQAIVRNSTAMNTDVGAGLSLQGKYITASNSYATGMFFKTGKDNATTADSHFYGSIQTNNGTVLTEGIRITSGQFVGIADSTPDQRLTVAGSTVLANDANTSALNGSYFLFNTGTAGGWGTNSYGTTMTSSGGRFANTVFTPDSADFRYVTHAATVTPTAQSSFTERFRVAGNTGRAYIPGGTDLNASGGTALIAAKATASGTPQIDLYSSAGTRNARLGNVASDVPGLTLYDSGGSSIQTFISSTNNSYFNGGGNLGIQTTTPLSNLDINGSLGVKSATTSSSSYTPGAEVITLANTTSNSVTVNLAAASTTTNRLRFIKKTAAANSVIIDPNASETINGTATYTLSGNGEGIWIQNDGSSWSIVGAMDTLASLTTRGATTANTLTVGNVIDSGLTATTVLYADGTKQISSASMGTGMSISGGMLSYTEADTLADVTGRNGVTTNSITVGNVTDSGVTANTLMYANGSKQLSSVTIGTGLSLTTGTLSTTALINPMTTSGDIIYGGASGVPTRLAAGSDGNVLTLAGGVPTWAAGASTPSLATVTGVGSTTSATITAGHFIDSGATANTLTYFNGSKQLTSVTIGSGLSFNTGTGTLSDTHIQASGTATWNPTTVGGNSETTITPTVTGAVVGQPVEIGYDQPPPSNCFYTAYVSATDTVTVKLINAGLVTSSDPPNTQFKIQVLQ